MKQHRGLDLKSNDLWIMEGCCLSRMKEIDDNSVDMVFCDPPYGVTRNKWDSVINLEEMWIQLKRITKRNAAICLMAQTPFDKVLGSSNISMLKYEWIWCKNKPTGHLNAKKMPMKNHENILVFYDKPPVYNPQKTMSEKLSNSATNKNCGSNYGVTKENYYRPTKERYPKTLLEIPVVNNDNSGEFRIHPTQKPVQLAEYFIKTYSNEGQTILDFTFGSGSTIKAALNLGRKVIGIENGICELDNANYFGRKYTEIMIEELQEEPFETTTRVI